MTLRIISLFTFMLTSCVAQNKSVDLAALDLSQLGNTEQEIQPFADRFASLCIKNISDISKVLPQENELNWSVTNDEKLNSLGLTNLRKKILEIPGGGARYRETQNIYVDENEGSPLVLNIEERFENEQLSSQKCEFYAKENLLESCAALGKILKQAPDRNQKYPEQNAHFISWNLKAGDRPAHLVCKQVPSSGLLPYDGIVLSLAWSANKLE